jgi:hypothetical protein
MNQKEYLNLLELINTEIRFFERQIEENDEINYNPFSRKARWTRALWRKIDDLNREIGVINYQYHGDESFPDTSEFVKTYEADRPFM